MNAPEKKIDLKQVTNSWNKIVVLTVGVCAVAFLAMVLLKFIGFILAYAGLGFFVGLYWNNAIVKLGTGLFAIVGLLFIWAFLYPWGAILLGIALFIAGAYAALEFFKPQ